MTGLRLGAQLASAALFVLSVVAGGVAISLVARQAAAADWPQAHSDMPADPAVLFGKLANGMRYAIMKNETPKGAVAMRFCVDAGSLQESDAQQGLAHFLEHMAFRGSRHVPENQVWPGLQRLGMGVGPDANAETNFTQTYYQFNLPRNDAATIDTGLLRLRDIASELTLAQHAMDDERGPILSEERLRDTPEYRAFEQALGFWLPDGRGRSRMPIGKTDIIRHAPVSLIRDFYNAYYRPERAVLIIVGDIDPKAIEEKIKTQFGDWAPVGPAGGDPSQSPPGVRAPEADLFVASGAQSILSLNWVTGYKPDSRAVEKADLIELLGLKILDYRLQELANSPQRPFAQTHLEYQHLLHSIYFRSLMLLIEPQHWQKAVEAATRAVRRIDRFGVSADEVARAIDEIRTILQTEAAKAGTRRSRIVADAIMRSVDEDSVFASPAEVLSLADETFKELTVDKVNVAVHGLMRGHGPLLFLSSPVPIEGGKPALAAALTAAEKAPLTEQTAEASIAWPYSNFGAAGRVVERKSIADLQTTFVDFANGVRLTVKPTSFATGEVLVGVKVGNGRLGLPADKDSAAWAFIHDGFAFGGLKALSFEEIPRSLAGKFFNVNTEVLDDGFLLSGRTRPQDLATQLQVLAAYVNAPGWRSGAIDRVRGIELSELESLGASPTGVLERDLFGLIHSGDRRWSTPTRTAVETLGPDGLKDLLQRQLASGPIEVTVVGDITADAAEQAVAGTFGALPRRDHAIVPSKAVANVRFPMGTAKPVELSHKGRADQGIAVVAWPAADAYDLKTEQGVRVLQKVIEWRLTNQLRIHDGATYSPAVFLGASMVSPGFGYLLAFAELPPDKMPLFFKVSDAIAKDLREHAISADELERARKPAVESIVIAQQTNNYWAYELLGAQTDPRRLDIVRNTISDLKAVTAAEVQQVAQIYLTTPKSWRAEIKSVAARSH
jgi:zinc protease